MSHVCIFCSIVEGKTPCYKVHENKFYLAFMDIFPRVKGHVLVIPKKHYRYVYDVPEFGDYFEFAKEVAMKAQKAVVAKYVSFLTVGEAVHHAHIHILPQPSNNLVGGIGFKEVLKVEKSELESLSKLIAKS